MVHSSPLLRYLEILWRRYIERWECCIWVPSAVGCVTGPGSRVTARCIFMLQKNSSVFITMEPNSGCETHLKCFVLRLAEYSCFTWKLKQRQMGSLIGWVVSFLKIRQETPDFLAIQFIIGYWIHVSVYVSCMDPCKRSKHCSLVWNSESYFGTLITLRN